MINSDTELLFPFRVIPFLQDLRGEEWQKLIERLSEASDDSVEKIAFTAMMVKLGGCSVCNADSFRAIRGCTQCARLMIKRFKGNDAELLELYDHAKQDVQEYMNKTH